MPRVSNPRRVKNRMCRCINCVAQDPTGVLMPEKYFWMHTKDNHTRAATGVLQANAYLPQSHGGAPLTAPTSKQSTPMQLHSPEDHQKFPSACGKRSVALASSSKDFNVASQPPSVADPIRSNTVSNERVAGVRSELNRDMSHGPSLSTDADLHGVPHHSSEDGMLGLEVRERSAASEQGNKPLKNWEQQSPPKYEQPEATTQNCSSLSPRVFPTQLESRVKRLEVLFSEQKRNQRS